MKKYAALFVVIPLILSSCFIFGKDYTEYWDGKLDGAEGLYLLEVTQSGKELVFTVQANDGVYGELLSSARGTSFTPPSEFFLWMAPTHAQDGNWNDSGNTFALHPVARRRITPDFFLDSDPKTPNNNPKIEIRVNLERIANDWNMNWLRPEHFDGDAEGEFGHNDSEASDMNGVYAFLADNFLQDDGYNDGDYADDFNFYGNWGKTWLTVPTADAQSVQRPFMFQKSRPFGGGYSTVAAILPEDWVPVTITPEGLRVSSYEVYGGIEFTVRLKLYEQDGSVTVELPTGTGSFTLNSANASQSDDLEYVWRIVYEKQDYVGLNFDVDTGTVHVPGLGPGSRYYLQYSWFSAEFNYVGYANIVFQTEFSDDFTMNTSPLYDRDRLPAGELTRTVQSPHPYDGSEVSNALNNWSIDDVASLPFAAGAGINGKVLGLGSGGVIANLYDNYRNDVIEFPAHDYWSLLYDENGNAINTGYFYVVFDMYKHLDNGWSHGLYLEIDDGYGNWQYVESWRGPNYEHENRGWRRYSIPVWATPDWNHNPPQAVHQRLRFRFYSDPWNTSDGVFIDNLKVLVLE